MSSTAPTCQRHTGWKIRMSVFPATPSRLPVFACCPSNSVPSHSEGWVQVLPNKLYEWIVIQIIQRMRETLPRLLFNSWCWKIYPKRTLLWNTTMHNLFWWLPVVASNYNLWCKQKLSSRPNERGNWETLLHMGSA